MYAVQLLYRHALTWFPIRPTKLWFKYAKMRRSTVFLYDTYTFFLKYPLPLDPLETSSTSHEFTLMDVPQGAQNSCITFHQATISFMFECILFMVYVYFL
jgi:hypothetical protein